MEYRYIDKAQFDDKPADQAAAEGRRAALKEEALTAVRTQFVAEKYAEAMDRLAAQIVVPDVPPLEEGEEPTPEQEQAEELAAMQQTFRDAAEVARRQAETERKSAERRRNRVREAGGSLTTKDINVHLVRWLEGTQQNLSDGRVAQSAGYLAQLETEHIQHSILRDRRQAALRMTGNLALNEDEAEVIQGQVDEGIRSIDQIEVLYAVYTEALKELKGALPKGALEEPDAAVDEETGKTVPLNREQRRSASKAARSVKSEGE